MNLLIERCFLPLGMNSGVVFQIFRYESNWISNIPSISNEGEMGMAGIYS